MTLVKALNGKRHDLHELLERLTPQVEMRVDWDEDAGERWARILIDADAIAMVHAHLPLAFLQRIYLEPLKNLVDAEGLNVVVVDQFDVPIL